MSDNTIANTRLISAVPEFDLQKWYTDFWMNPTCFLFGNSRNPDDVHPAMLPTSLFQVLLVALIQTDDELDFALSRMGVQVKISEEPIFKIVTNRCEYLRFPASPEVRFLIAAISRTPAWATMLCTALAMAWDDADRPEQRQAHKVPNLRWLFSHWCLGMTEVQESAPIEWDQIAVPSPEEMRDLWDAQKISTTGFSDNGLDNLVRVPVQEA